MPFHHISLPAAIYRISYGTDPLAYAPLRVLKLQPGRWDDPGYRFRTGYFGDSLETCFVELLASLRPDPEVVAALAVLGESAADLNAAVMQRLSHRWASTVAVPHCDAIVDVVHAHSRMVIESRLTSKTIKVGDFLGSDTRTSREAAGIAYDENEIGIAAPSAEAFCLAGKSLAGTFAIFERYLDANVARVELQVVETVEATAVSAALAAARAFLRI